MALDLPSRVRKALALGLHTHTVDDIIEAIGNETMQYWDNGDSLVVTEIVTFPRYKVVNIVLAAGDLREVMALQDQIEEYAQREGCVALRMQGREGWKRVLPDYGWVAIPRVLFEKPVPQRGA